MSEHAIRAGIGSVWFSPLTNATWSWEQIWKASTISLRFIPISVLISLGTTRENRAMVR